MRNGDLALRVVGAVIIGAVISGISPTEFAISDVSDAVRDRLISALVAP